VRAAEPFAALTILCMAAAPADAQESVQFNIPGGRLSDALIALGEQARITIGASDPGLAGIRSRPLRGRMSVRAALGRLLAGTGYSFTFVDARTVRIVRAAPAAPRRPALPRPRPIPPTHTEPPPAPPQPDIIVTASKQGVALDRFGGTVHMVDLRSEDVGRFGARGSEAVLNRLPMLASTSLGPGRNKIYIRGVADSSFNGPSQSIVGQYLGDVRLTFNAPDPDLHLYDIGRVELLEGPQGTLYGTGSLGGILRLVPNEPDLSDTAGAVAAGAMTIHHGDAGGDVAGMVNLPIVHGRLAFRAVGYTSIDGGYIDDPGRGLHDVNRTATYGGRATLLWEPGGGWRLELGGLAQYIAGRDGQYAMRGLPPLSRRTSLAQPFDNDYQLGQFTLRKRWSGVELVSATGVVRHALETRFDATGFPGTTGPQLYTEDIGITLVSNETRLSQPDAGGEGWVAGWSLLHDISRIRRRLGPPGAAPPIAGVRNEVTEAALFGQYSLALTDRLVGTIGGRLTYSRSAGMPLDAPDDSNAPDRTDLRASPTAAITWRLGRRLLLYGRFQQGFRAGGLAVSATGSAMSAQRFESDSLTSYEAGVRFGRPDADRLSFNAAISYARWADIQADLIDARGLPFTTNLGDGRIYGFEIEASWRATPTLSFDASAFINNSALSDPNPAFATADERALPNIARAGARAAAHFRAALSPSLTLALDGSVRYVGESHLGIGAPLDIDQGRFIDGQIGARLDFGRFGLSLDVDNVADARGNRFSFGNPFSVAGGRQTTPLRPRTVRIGFDAAF
jgi:outer membrane receptor protein involved in Fe transport